MALFKLEKIKGLRTGDKNEKKSLRISENKLCKNALCSTEWWMVLNIHSVKNYVKKKKHDPLWPFKMLPQGIRR